MRQKVEQFHEVGGCQDQIRAWFVNPIIGGFTNSSFAVPSFLQCLPQLLALGLHGELDQESSVLISDRKSVV